MQAEVIDALHGLFRDDLRGLLKALENGITALLGLTGNGDYAGPIGLADLKLVLSRRYGLELQDQLGATLWQRLAAWAARDAQAVLTQAELVALWGIKQPSVSQTLQQLIVAGAVEVLPRKGVHTPTIAIRAKVWILSAQLRIRRWRRWCDCDYSLARSPVLRASYLGGPEPWA